MSKELKSWLVKKPFDILLHLSYNDEWWVSKLSSRVDVTRQHCANIIEESEKKGLVKVHDEVNGKKLIELTEDGEELAEEFERLDKVMQEVEN